MSNYFKWSYRYGYNEFIEYVEKTKPHSNSEENASHEGDFGFTQTRSFKEAMDLAKYGWDSGIEELKDIFKEISIGGNTEIEWNMSGGIVDVPKYLNGEPDCMIEFIDVVEREKPEITIMVPLTYLAGVRGEDALNYLKEVIKEIIVPKMKTHSVRMVGLFTTKVSGGNELVKIDIKDFHQNLVLNSFAFAFHPSFFRRLWFKHLETKEYWQWGYGKETRLNLEELTEDEPKGEYLLVPKVNSSGLNMKNIKTLKK